MAVRPKTHPKANLPPNPGAFSPAGAAHRFVDFNQFFISHSSVSYIHCSIRTLLPHA